MSEALEALLQEGRTFAPSKEFRKAANVSGVEMYDDADYDWQGFWAQQALDLDWYQEWHTILEWELPFAKWFVGGKLNVSVNCLDRHVVAGKGDQVAFHWEGEPGDTRTLSYAQMLTEVAKAANALRQLGVTKGDRVAIYMGMVPELPIAMLACARIGAVHSVVFGGFTAQSLKDRINDAEAVALITQDGAWRRGSIFDLKAVVDEALVDCPSIRNTLVVRRAKNDVAMATEREHWWHDLVDAQDETCEPEQMDAEDVLP